MEHPQPLSRFYSRAVLIILTGVLFMSCGPGRTLKKELEKDFAEAEDRHHWFRGIMVYDPVTEKVIFEHNSHKYFTPASNTKLFTFYAGLKLLEDSIPALKYEVRNDSLFFKGTGDPSFLNKEFHTSKVLNLLKNRPEELVFISPEPSEKAFGPGWAWEDYNYSFAAERSDFPIFGNLVSFKIPSEASKMQVQPSLFRRFVKVDSDNVSNRIQRELLKNSFKLPLFETADFEQHVPFIYSPELAVELLADTLNRKVTLVEKNPFGLRLEKTIYSLPADSLYKRMLQESDNFVAEQLLLVAAGVVSDTLQAQKAISFIKEQYLHDLPDEIKWVDGSGLSRYNLFTPRSIVKLLDKILKEIPEERILALLPSGGVSGTLKNDYKAPEGVSPFVYAKTGTLNNNYSLSGYLITAKGKLLIFSFMNSNYLIPTAVVRAEIDKVLQNIYLNY